MKTSFISNAQAINWPTPSSTDIEGPPELARISDRICALLKETLGLSARLHGAADRAMGPTPTGCGEAAAKPQAMAMVPQIDDLLSGMESALARCIEAADRFERLA